MGNSQQPTSDLIGQRQHRLEKIELLKKRGFNPYPSKASKTHDVDEIVRSYDELQGTVVAVAGRIMSWRSHGDLIFADLQDRSGRIQIYIHLADVDGSDPQQNSFGSEDLDLLDLGDHIEVSGEVTKTKRGEVSIKPGMIKLLSKAIRPLPNKFGSIEDTDLRYRRRYLDMTMSPEVRKRFERRAKFWDEIRKFLNSQGFVEVNIPVLEHTTGGADAKPFVTHYDALGEDFYLRISHELPLKRLLGAGFERVYDIGPRFRNEGFSDEHLPEHIAMEWYWAYADYREGMKMTENMFKHVAQEVYGTLKFQIGDHSVDLGEEWGEIDFATLIEEEFSINVFDDSLEQIKKALITHNPNADIVMNRGRLVDSLWKILRKDISGPVFLTGVPKFLSPLAKASVADPRKTDRFHPIIAGTEMANAFTELNDPVDQLDRFVEQQRLKTSGDDEAHMMDIDYVEMLEYGMPPAVGFGLSERVFWMLENVTAREGVPFPPMRRDFDKTTRKLYKDVYDFDAALAEAKGDERNESMDGEDQGTTVRLTKKSSAKIQDFSHKMIIVLNKDIEGWIVANTVGQISAQLGKEIGENLNYTDTFKTKDSELIANSQYPLVALGAKPGQMYNFLKKVREHNLVHLAYIKEMVDYTDDKSIQEALQDLNEADLVYYGIGVFGDNKTLDQLTKKFSLWS